MGRRTFHRNRLIVQASLDGSTTKELARRFNLAQKSVAEIIRNERHRLELSLDPVYRSLRKTGWGS
jgi:Mor family transcriptional regulator